jgi:hypothetical protein
VRVLALDLAIGRTGWAVLDQIVSHGLVTCAATGIISPPTHKLVGDMLGGKPEYGRGALGVRQYRHVMGVLEDLMSSYAPDFLAYEYPARPFHERKPRVSKWGIPNDADRRVSPTTEFNAMRGLANSEGWVEAWVAERWPDKRLVSVPVHMAKAFVTGLATGRAHEDAPKPRVAQLIESHWHIRGLVDQTLLADGVTPKLGRDGKPELKYDRSDAVSVGLCALYRVLADQEQAERVRLAKATARRSRSSRKEAVS